MSILCLDLCPPDRGCATDGRALTGGPNRTGRRRAVAAQGGLRFKGQNDDPGAVHRPGENEPARGSACQFLNKMKAVSKEYLIQNKNDVVATIPTNFNGSQHQQTTDAVTVLGPSMSRVISNTTIAAIAYILD